MSSRSSLMFLSVNGTAQSYGVIPERSPIEGATRRMPRSSKLCPRVSDVSHPGRLDRLDLLELHISHVFEQPSAASEQDRDDRDDNLVEQTRCKVLLRDGRPTPERHLLLSGCCPRKFERRRDSVRNEVECRSALHLQRLARMASEDEDGMV